MNISNEVQLEKRTNFFKDKDILVAGGTGLIGTPLVRRLLGLGGRVTVVSLDKPRETQDFTFLQSDLRELDNCLSVTRGRDIVFNLVGIKGSPAMAEKKPASFFVPTISLNTNMMEAARRCKVERFLYTSTIGVYAPAETFVEGDMWNTFPSINDRFAGWAKRMGELQAEAYRIEYGWEGISIVRPANVYGPNDNFDPRNAMVIPSLIHRVCNGEDPLAVWGDGTAVRDFIHADDVARGMIEAVRRGIKEPINLGSGCGVSIKEIAETIVRHAPGGPAKLVWDKTQPSGDSRRIMDVSRAESYGIKPLISIDEGIEETVDWYVKNKNCMSSKYNAFLEN